MRKVRHKNVVQFIGACTRQPNLCILVEYMAGGSVYDHMRARGLFRLSKVAEIALQVSKGAAPNAPPPLLTATCTQYLPALLYPALHHCALQLPRLLRDSLSNSPCSA